MPNLNVVIHTAILHLPQLPHANRALPTKVVYPPIG
jgi:hypothetical protein